MKKIFLLVLPFVFLFSNCKKDNAVLFEMEYFHDFEIRAGLNPFSGTSVFVVEDIPSRSDALFSQNGITADELNAINPGIAVLRGIFTNPDNSYIQEISVKIFSKEDPTFEREIFYRDQVALNASGDLSLVGTLVDAKDFLRNENFGIRIELRLRDISPETIEMRLDFGFFAK